jgi:hypothetical protein
MPEANPHKKAADAVLKGSIGPKTIGLLYTLLRIVHMRSSTSGTYLD